MIRTLQNRNFYEDFFILLFFVVILLFCYVFIHILLQHKIVIIHTYMNIKRLYKKRIEGFHSRNEIKTRSRNSTPSDLRKQITKERLVLPFGTVDVMHDVIYNAALPGCLCLLSPTSR